jgi:hypothetical protein
MKQFKLIIFQAIFFTFLFSSYSKESNNEASSAQKKSETINTDKYVEKRISFARLLSKVLEDENVAQGIEKECLRSKSVDAEILVFDLLKKKINESQTLLDVLKSELQERSLSDLDLNNISNSDPLMTLVLMPGKGKSRSTMEAGKTKANKIYVDKIFDEYKDGEKMPYFLDGKEFSISYERKKEPNEAYFAIKHNEDHVAYYNSSKNLFYQPEYNLLKIGFDNIENRVVFTNSSISIAKKFEDITLNSSKDGTSLEQRTSCGQECERDCCNGKDAIYTIEFTHDYEGWPKGGPEFVCQFALGVNNNVNITAQGFVVTNAVKVVYALGGDEFTTYTKNRSGTWLYQIQLFNWNKTTHSRDALSHWSEDDGEFRTYSLSANLKVKILGVETSITGSLTAVGGDDEVGSTYVQYCDPYDVNGPGYLYVVAGPDGDIKFTQRDRCF